MPRSLQFDRQLFGVTLALCLVGAVMVFSASSVKVFKKSPNHSDTAAASQADPAAQPDPSATMAREQVGNPYSFLLRQLAWLAIGLGGMFWLMNKDYREFRRPKLIFGALSAVILLLLCAFLFDRSHETHRWIRLGPLGIQPSEIAKLVVILYVAWFIQYRRQTGHSDVNDFRNTLVPVLGPVLVIAGLVLIEPDLGTACMILFVAFAMLFIAGLSPRWIGGAAVLAIPAVAGLIRFAPYRMQRFMAFLHPDADLRRHGFQLAQSLIAVGSGGLTGVGLMESRQKLFYLPEAHTDFIYAVISEELGFVGAILLLALFAWFGWRGLRTAIKAPDEFGRLAALGITVLVVGQALINLSVVLGLVPTKGIPLPFVSYGGSSLLVMLLATGVLLNISQHAD
jgi:cell division protein FtsW